METCTAHGLIEKRIDDIQRYSDERDRENEQAISGVVRTMEDLHRKIEHIETSIEELRVGIPGTVREVVVAAIDTTIASTVKSVVKWFFRFIIGGSVIAVVMFMIQKILGG